jgi:hypothetical protein
MTIRRRCTERNCKNGRKCLEHLRFDVMFRGKRYRIPANEFAIPRMEPGKQRPIQSMEEARDWERLFIGEIKAGRDLRRPRTGALQAGSELRDVSAFLDAYMERCVKPAGLRSIAAVRSRVGVLKQHSGSDRWRPSKIRTRSISSRPTRGTPRTWRSRRSTASSKHCERR